MDFTLRGFSDTVTALSAATAATALLHTNEWQAPFFLSSITNRITTF